jgi:hypothetical protein
MLPHHTEGVERRIAQRCGEVLSSTSRFQARERARAGAEPVLLDAQPRPIHEFAIPVEPLLSRLGALLMNLFNLRISDLMAKFPVRPPRVMAVVSGPGLQRTWNGKYPTPGGDTPLAVAPVE